MQLHRCIGRSIKSNLKLKSATQNDACMQYNKNMKKILLLTAFVLITVNTTFALDVAQRITYSNGTMVLLCDNNGKIDYCSEQDRQNSIKALNNPNVTVIEQITLKQESDNGFNQKCYKTQKKIQAGASLTNAMLDSARAITNMIGVSW